MAPASSARASCRQVTARIRTLDTASATRRAISPLARPSPSLRVIQDAAGYSYLVSEPPAAASADGATTRFPLLLFLHGVSERGVNVEDVMRQGVPRLISGGSDLSAEERAIGEAITRQFIVVAPQCPPLEVWDEAKLLTLLDRVVRDHLVDARRVYLCGLSMGGFGTWGLAMRHPEKFAAIVAVCGGGRVRDVAAALPERLAAQRTLGVWAFHGALDRIVPLEESERMVAALQAAGASDVKLTVYPEVSHDAWTRAFLNPELYAWLLRHARPCA